MASMNYCFTVCRASEENIQQKDHLNKSTSTAIDIPNSSSPSSPGAYFFGRFFSFASTPSPSPSSSTTTNPFILNALNTNDMMNYIS
ncbi:unnamed protein product [Adineta steineri]|uniref:Uncharacterized protein n=1 Tax=Adineta steineri TaxID=433720 RepID=A0A815GUL4_9BILA|nr:unnamed protein product [Adineta steineri]CAF1345050.1 unnamed protein product [Adineta steineri]